MAKMNFCVHQYQVNATCTYTIVKFVIDNNLERNFSSVISHVVEIKLTYIKVEKSKDA